VIPIAITRNMSLRVDGVMVCSTYGAPAQKDGACAGTTRSADLVRRSEHCKHNLGGLQGQLVPVAPQDC
jgi:hypothetical protein